MGTRTPDKYTRAVQHNVRAIAGDNTGLNTDKGHAPNPRTEIKIPDSAGNRTGAAGLEDRDSTGAYAILEGLCIKRKLKNREKT